MKPETEQNFTPPSGGLYLGAAVPGPSAGGERGPTSVGSKGSLMESAPGIVLVVDDVEANRDLLSRRLQRQGHSVAVAENGQRALEMLRAQPFDLVLLDIMMPVMNGFQVLEQLKADEQLRHLPVIVISALDDLDSVVKCIEMGAEDYLSKPFNPVLLKARVGACLEKKRLHDQEKLHLCQLQEEKKRADDLLRIILPWDIAEELKAHHAVKPRRHENVAVLFGDIVGFTSYCNRHPPEEVVDNLQQMIEACEDLALEHDLEKIKTIGDAFMATAGLLRPVDNPVLNCVRCGLSMIAAARALPARWELRIGIHVGPVMAGVVGKRKYLYDIWGDTVNTASRIESLGTPGTVWVSGSAWKMIADCCRGTSRGLIPVKGKGELEMFSVEEVLSS
jgi:class 3 adenylate cyclase